MIEKVRFIDITASSHGQRIDNFLLKTLKGVPRSRIYRIIRKGEVRVNKKRVKPTFKLGIGDQVRVPPLRMDDPATPVTIPADLLRKLEDAILFENQAIIVLNKPSGLAVHSGSGLRYGVIDALRKMRPDDVIELVHRLDRDTSGCLLLAKSRPALLEMQNLFTSSRLRKTYQAIVKGRWDSSVTRISTPLLKQTMPNGERRVYVDERGQKADTEILSAQSRRLSGVEFSHLMIRLWTGRTHQIRVHCQSLGHEIGGDAKYGDRVFNRQMKNLGAGRLLLHAWSLEIPQNAYTKALNIIAPEPDAFNRIITDCQPSTLDRKED